ncbi:MAG: hypothetical protein J5702_01825 [Bacteroidales bacterium]|nr:hypothetical protein [Bacteroidales bacterium]
MRSRRFLLLLVILSAVGCSKPAGDYLFVSDRTAAAHGGRYEFTFSLDSACTYTTTLAARVVASRAQDGELNLDIRTISPDGSTQIERLPLSLAEEACLKRIEGSGSLLDCQWHWQDIRTDGSLAGTWQVFVTPTDEATADALQGIGLSYERIEWEKAN